MSTEKDHITLVNSRWKNRYIHMLCNNDWYHWYDMSSRGLEWVHYWVSYIETESEKKNHQLFFISFQSKKDGKF